MVDPISLREANADDAAALGVLHVTSWRETYTGILPDELLNGLSVDQRTAMWGAVLNAESSWGGTSVFVAESGGGLIGFGACGAQRDEGLQEQGFDGEIGAIYVLKSHQRAGVGTAMMRMLAGSLLDRGRNAASLWVLRENELARTFYEVLDGTLLGERANQLDCTTVVEVAYGWSDLTSLV